MKSILDTIGNTPLVKLDGHELEEASRILIKMERTNPGGSIKDRPALYLIEWAEKMGYLKPGGTIIESSSGNFGISLAMIGAAKGYHVIILVDPKTTAMNLAMLKAYGAQVIVVEEQDDCGSYHKTRIKHANRLHREIPNSFRPDQCFNPLNAVAHYEKTAQEIFNQCNGKVDAVVISVSTGGQIGGISKFFKEVSPKTKIIAVDAKGSAIFGGESHAYLLQGMGLGWTPVNINDLSLIDEVYKVPDEDAFLMCRALVRNQGIMVGSSTGASVFVAFHLAQKYENLQRIVCMGADNGERYLNSVYNDQWMSEKGFALDPSIREMFLKSKELKAHSTFPVETANYRDDLIDSLDSPSKWLIELEEERHIS